MNDKQQSSYDLQTPEPKIPSTPPIVAGEIPPKTKKWPKILGIIFIVFGVLGIFQGCSGLVSPFIFGLFKTIVPEDKSQVLNAMNTFKPWLIVSAAFILVMAAMLLTAGVGIVSRKAWSRKISLYWACSKIVVVGLNSLLGYAMQKAQFQAMQEMIASDPNSAAAMPMSSNIMMAIGIVTLIFTIIWGWALPVFTLIWFSRKKIRSEVTSWDVSSHTVIQENISTYGRSIPSD